ncbi:MAG TPA: hypothetical protein VNZ44_03820, partial [Pyrinomonadaceae bacterium]|nr:hypothetical protein [Pyrinomonadaceae bacterium]
MNNRSFLLLSLTAAVFAPASSARAQDSSAPTFTRPRVVNVARQQPTPAASPAPTQTPAQRPAVAQPTQTPARPAATPAQTVTAPTRQGTTTPAQQATPGVSPTPVN